MTILQSSIVPSSGYQISRSLRFNSADSAYLNRTPASAGNRRTWTWSGWVKRSFIGATNTNGTGLFGAGTLGNNANFRALFDSGAIYLQETVQNVSNQLIWTSTPVYRDPSAWYHIVIAMDTTQATAANRVKVYVNGSQITGSFSVTPSQNQDTSVNNNVAQYQGASPYNSAALWYLDGYITELNFIDGQALTPSSFGQSDPNTGVWSPIKYTGTYGTNGFYLNFSDNSGTTSTTLGKDSSGNGNNWTPNNFSVTAGAGNDSLVDTPTSYGTDTGAGGEVRGNYCVVSPIGYRTTTPTPTITNGNLDVVCPSGTTSSIGTATFGVSSGKWYWEATKTGTAYGNTGIVLAPFNMAASSTLDLGGLSNEYTYVNSGSKFNNNSSSAYGASYTNNDVIGIALDLDAGTLTFYKNGVSQGTAYSSLPAGTYLVGGFDSYNGSGFIFNFGQRPFAYTAPSGFKALCTQNLPTPTIGATSTTQAGKYFNTVLYTGNGSTQSITGVGFQPDWVWIKSRSNIANHALFDVIRGTGNVLQSNTTAAAATDNTTLTAFNSDGFSLGAAAGSYVVNTSTYTFVAWNWNAGGSNATNTSGTITSTVRANTTAGFSIVTYTGTGANATVGHGLGVAPSMVIVKRRDGGSDNWQGYHISLGKDYTIKLNTTQAQENLSNYWGSGGVTSTVFGINGTYSGINANGGTYVAYCFAAVAGYSAFGSYTGNGSADGPFVYLGFRPRFILTKSSSDAFYWVIEDAARNPSNVVDLELFPNDSLAETNASRPIDFLSNGFKIRHTGNTQNASGGTYIYAAFAEVPQKFSLAR